MRCSYIVNPPKKQETTYLAHAWTAAQQRANYSSQKRHERYMEARNAGKTGYQGLGARATNPNGDYANVYYDPQKAAEYYQANKKTT